MSYQHLNLQEGEVIHALRRVRRWYGSLSDEGWDTELNFELRAMASPNGYDFHYLVINRRYGKQQIPLPVVYASSEEDAALLFTACGEIAHSISPCTRRRRRTSG